MGNREHPRLYAQARLISCSTQLCVTLEDWEEYIEQLATSKHQNEKVFHKYLVKDVLPAIRDDVEVWAMF